MTVQDTNFGAPIAREGDVPDFIAAHARFWPDRTACVDLGTGQKFTYRQLHARIERCAAFFADVVGAVAAGHEGERIAFLARNRADILVAQFAAERIGAILVPLNWRLAAAELQVQLVDAAPCLLIFEAAFDEVAGHLVRSLPAMRTLRIADGDDQLSAALAAYPEPPPHRLPRLMTGDAPIMLLFTSGTSGRPKGVIITNRSAFHSTMNFAFCSWANRDSVFLCDTPMFHVMGALAASRTPLLLGGTVLISPQFDAALTLQRLGDRELGITHMFGVPQMAERLRERPEFAGTDLSRLVGFFVGGAPTPPVALKAWLAHGVNMVEGFGMTESGTTLGMPPGDRDLLAKKAGSVGLAAPSVQVRLVDGDGRDVAEGQAGEMWLKGPNITPGYWRQPEATREAFQDGWLRTGDAAWRDADGFYFLGDRLKDMYISGGENVYPKEVEAVLAELPQLAQAAVIGVPDGRWGEVGCAYVVAAEGATISAEAVIAHCSARLARYKVPKMVVFTDSLPRTATGKLRKAVLRKQHQEGK